MHGELNLTSVINGVVCPSLANTNVDITDCGID